MDLHTAIKAYFDADRRRDRDALTGAFAPDASVADEGHTYVGQEAIGAWWSEAKGRYEAVLEPLDARQTGDATVVRAQASGNFPGSPAVLTFDFRLAGDRIQALEIRA